jgi:hypothetical protein
MPHWLGLVDFPLFVSHRRLARYRNLPRAVVPWALDSGGFTELSSYGEWRTTPEAYVNAVRRYRDEVGRMEWAAPQDWMCEPWITAKTGMSVAEHQQRTVRSYLELRDLAPDMPFVPVIQGWRLGDYLRQLDAYAAAGVDLTAEPVVGLGSVCRRQGTGEIGLIVTTLASYGLRLHGFGVKTEGLADYADDLHSADSMAWSMRGRHVPGCAPNHRNEANCLRFARMWRDRLLEMVATRPRQLALPLFTEVTHAA